MKKIFEFTMPDDSDDYKIYSQSMAMHSVLHDLSQELRNKCKYEKHTKADEFWRGRFHELLAEHGIELI